MKYVFSLLFVLGIISMAISQTITLNGHVLTDEHEAVPQTQITVSGGYEDYTDDSGEFNIKLSSDYVDGEQVILQVHKNNWVINHPLDGIWNIPNVKYQYVHTTKVIIVQHGSMALWSHARIEKLMVQLSDDVTKSRATIQALEASATKPQAIDFTYYLGEWADTYGFTPEEVKQEFDRWANEAQSSTDYRKKGLAAFYKESFLEAARNFEQAAQKDEAELKKIKEAAQQKRLSAYENRKDAGKAFYLAYQFDSSLLHFQKAAALINQTDRPVQWYEIALLLGNAKAELGIRTVGNKYSTRWF